MMLNPHPSLKSCINVFQRKWKSKQSQLKLNPRLPSICQKPCSYNAPAHMGVKQGMLSTPLEKEPKLIDHAHFTTQRLLLFMTYKATVKKKKKYCKILPFLQITATHKCGNFIILVGLVGLVAHQLLSFSAFYWAYWLMFILLAAVVRIEQLDVAHGQTGFTLKHLWPLVCAISYWANSTMV